MSFQIFLHITFSFALLKVGSNVKTRDCTQCGRISLDSTWISNQGPLLLPSHWNRSQIKSFLFIITQFYYDLLNPVAIEHGELSAFIFYLCQYNEYNCNHSAWWANCMKSWMITFDEGHCAAHNCESRYWSNIWFIIMEMGFMTKFLSLHK